MLSVSEINQSRPAFPADLLTCHHLLSSAWTQITDLQAENAALQQRYNTLLEQFNTNSSNSSTSPSSDSPKAKAQRHQKTSNDWEKQVAALRNKRKQGAQPGHKGYGRHLVPADQIHQVIPHFPEKLCADCGEGVTLKGICQRKQVFDLPESGLFITEHQIYRGKCGSCHKKCRGQLPIDVPKGILGNHAIAKLGLLTGDFHLSKREAVRLLHIFYGLTICVGTLSNMEGQLSQSLQAPTDEMKAAMQNSELGHADETGFPIQHEHGWLWLFASQDYAVFQFAANRSKEIAQELIGKDYQGMLVTDRYNAYHWIPDTQHQYCWAHLKRTIVKISEKLNPKEGYIGACLLSDQQWLFNYYHRSLGTNLIGHEILFLERAKERFQTHVERGATLTGTYTAGVCKQLLKHWDCLWHFMKNKAIPATNNYAERLIRSAVLWRKKSFGVQSVRGARFTERILSVVTTVKLQKMAILPFLARCLEAHQVAGDYPSLVKQ